MSEVKLNNDSARAEWLTCLQAAATLYAAATISSTPEIDAAYVAVTTDLLFAEYRKRCKR